MKRILIIGMNYAPEITGIGKYTGELSCYLAKQNFHVQVVTGVPYYPNWAMLPGYKNNQYTSEVISDVHVLRSPMYIPNRVTGSSRVLQEISFFLTSFFATCYLMIRNKKFHVVLVVAPSMLSGLIGVWYRFWNRNSKFIYHIQDLQIDAAEELNMIRQPIVLIFLKRVERFILKNASTVSTISAGMKKRILTKCKSIKKTMVLPNWVDDSKIFVSESNSSLLLQLGLPVDKKLILYSGAMGEKQGLSVLLDVAKWASVEQPELHFVLSGTGPYANHLREKAVISNCTNIHFIELQPLEQFNQLLNSVWMHLVIQKANAADLVLPSKLSNIMAVGGLVLVTASENTSLYEIVNGHRTGYVVPPDDSTGLINGIKYLHNNEDVVVELKRNAQQYAQRHLKKEHVINSFIQELETL
ncbi:MAG: WcaI family glycosyltransferase [Lacibacter sp.]